MNRLEELLREHFPQRIRSGDRIIQIIPPIPLFVFVGALSIECEKLKTTANTLENEMPEEDVPEALESWVIETADTHIVELACYEYTTDWPGEIKAVQVFMAAIEGSNLLGIHTEDSSPAWLIDCVASAETGIVEYFAGLQLPSDRLLRIVRPSVGAVTETVLYSALSPN